MDRLCSDGVILVSFLEKMVPFFLGTLIFGEISMIRIFGNDTMGGLKKVCFWVLNGDFLKK
jgi:hypothetical protein